MVDQGKVLKPAEVLALADKLKALEDRTGAQVAILTVPSAGQEGIAQFANRVFVAWGLGHKGVDDGVLIVLATRDRRVRIEVGRGLEGDIPDVIAKRITADTMAPLLKDGHYAEGLGAGIDALATHIGKDAGSTRDADQPPPVPPNIGASSAQLMDPWCGSEACNNDLKKIAGVVAFLVLFIAFLIYKWRHTVTRRHALGGASGSDFGSSSSGSSSSSSNDSSGGGGDSAGGGSDSSY